MARRVERRGFDVAVRTDPRNRSLAREELLPMTIQARYVFRKVGEIFANYLVTRIALEFFFSHVSGMGKVGSARLRQRETDHDKY